MNGDEAQARITENVLKLMGVRGYYTQEALGERIGKKAPEMSKRIKGHTRWSLADVLALSEALDVQAGELLSPLAVTITSLGATGTDSRVAVAALDEPATDTQRHTAADVTQARSAGNAYENVIPLRRSA